MMAAMLSVSITSCGGDDSPVSTPPPVPNDGNVVSNQDPEGTIVVNMNNGSSGNWISIGLDSQIHINAANNFEGYNSYVDFASVGEISGLNKITSIPTSGWAKSAAVIPGTGYVVRYRNSSSTTYARLYVVEHTVNTAGGIMGATVKYQCPFQLPIVSSTTSLTFTSAASEQTLTLSNPTTIAVMEKPEWCNVSAIENLILVHVSENFTAQQRTGNIVLKNTANSITINVIQQASSSPSFQAGIGTAADPYQIKTAKQLESMSKALNAYFVLTADIDLNTYLNTNGSGWDPIGKSETPFTGNFDGKGHIIKGLWIRLSETDGVGLFGYAKNATITNVRIKIGSNGINGRNYTGGLCGQINKSYVTKCSVEGVLSGNAYVGGLIGRIEGNNTSSVRECFTVGSIISVDNCCGIVYCDDSYSHQITNCYSTTTLRISRSIGICYGIANASSITNCYYAGQASNTGVFECGGTYTYYDSSVLGSSVRIRASYNNARTTDQMKTQSNYEGWDFNTIWKITERSSYPTLRCFD